MGLYENKNGVLSPIAGRGNIDGVYKAQGILGAKNLFNFDTPTETSGGITFENNGGIITANGTSGSDTYPFIECRKTLPAGNYIVTGCPSGGGDVSDPDNYQIIVRLTNGGGQILGVDYGDGFTFTLDQSSVVNVRCMTSKDMTVTNLIFKPMFRLASDTDSTYQPYAMTNKELTDKYKLIEQNIPSSLFESSKVSSSSGCWYFTKNGICTFKLHNIAFTEEAISGGADQLILPNGTLPKPPYGVYGVMVDSQNNSILLTITAAGGLIVNIINHTTAGTIWNGLIITYPIKE